MVYQIPSDLLQRIEAQVVSGDDVLREAMDTLERRQRGLQELRRKVQEAEIAAGQLGPFDAAETKQAVRERLRQKGITD